MYLEKLNQQLDEFHLLKHPFYVAWNNGELNKEILKDIALAGLGNFFWFDNNRDTHKNIKEVIEKMEKKTISTNEFSEFENRYQYFVLISIFFFMVSLFLPTNVQG